MPDREHTEEWIRSVLGADTKPTTIFTAEMFHLLVLHEGDPYYRGSRLKPAGHRYLKALHTDELGPQNVNMLREAHGALGTHPIDLSEDLQS